MDPNLMSDFMKNPEMMKSAMDMLKNNPGLMEQMMGMGQNDQSKSTNNLDDTEYNLDDTITINGLSNDTYNNQHGLVKDYNQDKDRYVIYIEDLDKTLSIKPTNISILKSEEETISIE